VIAEIVTDVAEDRTFEDNLERYGLDAFRLARFLGRTPEDAADVVQEAAILAWRYRKTLRGEWRPWFLAIVRRVAHRRQSGWTLVPWSWQPDPGGIETDWLGPSDVQVALARLPRRQRAAVWLRYGQDLAYREVGVVMGMRESAAKQLVARARAALRMELRQGLGNV
jgi:DNA-directed RNA polymerase specialized sigma24 family protein